MRLKKSRDKGAFYHKLFQKDQPRLTLHLSRKQMKTAMEDWKSSDGSEPDLYEGISSDILLAGEQMHALRGKKKRKRESGKESRKKPRSTKVAKKAVKESETAKTNEKSS